MNAARHVLPLLLAAWLPAAAGADAPQATGPLLEQARSLLESLAADYPGQADIHVLPPQSFNQPACEELEAFLPGSRTLRSQTSVGIRCLAPRPWTTYLKARVQIIGPYFVASRSIPRGATLTMDDLDSREGDLLRQRRALNDPARIVGWVATRRIRAGAAIEPTMMRDPDAVERGQTVRTIARGAGFVASSEGVALESGSPGTRIQVRTSSGQILSGTVIDAHTVQVMM